MSPISVDIWIVKPKGNRKEEHIIEFLLYPFIFITLILEILPVVLIFEELGLVFIFMADLECIKLAENFSYMSLSEANKAISFKLDINTAFAEKELSSKFNLFIQNLLYPSSHLA